MRLLEGCGHCSGEDRERWRAACPCDSVSEWPRRWTRNPLGSALRGSNPLAVVVGLSLSACKQFLGAGAQKSVHLRYSLAGQDTQLSPERPGFESRWRNDLPGLLSRLGGAPHTNLPQIINVTNIINSSLVLTTFWKGAY